MRKLTLKTNKRGVSEMVAYVLMIIMAIGLSIMVYSYLKQNVPKFETPECSSKVSLIINSATCIASNLGVRLQINLLNQGFFNVSAVYIRMGLENKNVKVQMNKEDIYFRNDLSPGKNISLDYLSTDIKSTGNYVLEVEPAVLTSKGLAVCDSSIITQPIVCAA